MRKALTIIFILLLVFCVACDMDFFGKAQEEQGNSANTDNTGDKETVTAAPIILPSDRNLTELSAMISMTCETEGAEIWFTNDGSDPRSSETKQLYSEPFLLANTQHKIRAYATHAGLSDSAVAVAAFSYPTVKNPTITPNDFFFSSELYVGEKVEISCETEGASIYYTTDGTVPTIDSTLYSEPLDLMALASLQTSVKVSAIAVKEGMQDSIMVQREYGVNDSLARPSFNPSVGEVEQGTQVSITCRTPEAVIYYKIDSGDYSVYEGPITINSDCDLYAYSHLEGYDDSMVYSAHYTISVMYETKTSSPVLSIPSGSIKISDCILITCPEENATIYYTVDGTDPRTSKTRQDYNYNHSIAEGVGVYLDSMEDRSFELQACAIVNEKTYSDVVSATYSVEDFSLYRTWEISADENNYSRLILSEDGSFTYNAESTSGKGNHMAGTFSIEGNTIVYTLNETNELLQEEEQTICFFSEGGQQFVTINGTEYVARLENDVYYFSVDALFGILKYQFEISFNPDFKHSNELVMQGSDYSIVEEVSNYELLDYSSGEYIRENPETYRIRIITEIVTLTCPLVIENGMIFIS